MREAKSRWAQLDTAAKIFPCTSGRRDTKVFRFVCELNEPVDPALLQAAVEETVDFFPGFRMVLKRGLFWYYLEDSALQAAVQPDTRPPCSPLYDKEVTGLLFSVTWYSRCINLEVYHAISDGTGAMHFLRMLVFCYLKKSHPEALADLPQLDYDASLPQSMDDGFEHYATAEHKKKPPKLPPAYHLRGSRTPDFALSVVVGAAPVEALLAISRAHNASLTAFLCALFIHCIGARMQARDYAQPVTLAVPINLRNHFESASARNFFGVMDVSYSFSQGGRSLEEILKAVQEQFQTGLTPDQMQRRVNQYIGLIRNPFARITPLPLKDLAIKLGYRANSRRETGALSNIGIVHMPEALAEYIRQFSIFVSTEKLQLCTVTYNGRITMGFSSAFQDMEVQKDFFRALTRLGVPVEIDTNLQEGEGRP